MATASKLIKNEKDIIDSWSNPYVDLAFICKICRKTQQHRCNWKRHYLSHSDVRSYNCNLCDKQFKTNDTLKRHMTSHNNTMEELNFEDTKSFFKLE